MSEDKKRLLSGKEAIEFLGVSKTTFYELIKLGKIKPYKIIKLPKFKRTELEFYLESLEAA